MVIRDQNKTKLVDTTSLAIVLQPEQKYNNIIAYHTNDLSSMDYIPLGTYFSEEKAMKVLEALCLEIRTCRTFFQMPQDEEVE